MRLQGKETGTNGKGTPNATESECQREAGQATEADGSKKITRNSDDFREFKIYFL